ncbi:MAG: OadG family protein [Firmicutes bacterium]|nr:OadG family protein [Bacillota bacterium]
MILLDQAAVLKSLEIMGTGMLGIFFVLGAIALVIYAISAIDCKAQLKKEQQAQQEEQTGENS